MKRLVFIYLFLPLAMLANGQGAGFGFQFDFGYKGNFDVGEGYDQQMQTFGHSFYIRWFSNNGRKAHQLVSGVRVDSIGFKNNSFYYDPASESLGNYNVDAYLKRVAWRFGYMEHLQFLGTPGKFCVSWNYGMFYEFTSQMKRRSNTDFYAYNLYSEQNRHNLIFATGIEARVWWFTVGYKWEHMFFDMINHEYIKQQPQVPGNGSELRGLKLSPSMSFFYMVINFDFYNPEFD